jgi:glycosyltransferase involved in cell wall biosynthesis
MELTVSEPIKALAESRTLATAFTKVQPTRVMFFDHTAILSGGEIALLRLVRELDREKVSPVVVLGADGPLADALRPIAETYVLPISDGVATTRKGSLGIKSLFRLREVWSIFAYIWRLVRFIRRNHIDLIHTNSLKADIIGGVAGRLAMRPVLWHIRDRIDEGYLPKRVVSLFRVLCHTIPRYVIANSFSTLRTLAGTDSFLKNIHPATQKMAVVHDGTEVGEVNHPFESGRATARIGLVGRICSWKGQHIFLQAVADVHREYPNAEFVIIGAALFGEDAYEAELHHLSRQLAIENVVEFAGFRKDIDAAISELDILVHASTIGEPFGQVIIEGMAAHKPVVATDGGGVPEIVQDGETGLLVPMGDAQAMASAILQLLANPTRAKEMGRRGRQRVLAHFTVKHTARKVESIYDELLVSA